MNGHSLVKGERFDSWRRIGAILPAIRVFEMREADEIVLLDTKATLENRGPDIEAISRVADELSTPLTVGGGVRDLDTIRELLNAGADKITICTAALDDPGLIDEAAKKFGSQCVTVAIDVSMGMFVASDCGKNIRLGLYPPQWAKTMESCGAGEILLTSIERDGVMAGYDLDLIRSVCEAVSIPVIASGGARDYDDFAAAFEAGAHAVAASALFQFTEKTPLGAKQHLAEKGVPVRL